MRQGVSGTCPKCRRYMLHNKLSEEVTENEKPAVNGEKVLHFKQQLQCIYCGYEYPREFDQLASMAQVDEKNS